MENKTMAKFKSDSNNYDVLPIKVKNSKAPWLEIYKQGVERDCKLSDLVIIEPEIGIDPFNENNNVCRKNNEITNKIFGSYIAEDITCETNDENMPIIIKASFI